MLYGLMFITLSKKFCPIPKDKKLLYIINFSNLIKHQVLNRKMNAFSITKVFKLFECDAGHIKQFDKCGCTQARAHKSKI